MPEEVRRHSLHELALEAKTDKASNGHAYTAVYEPLFEPFRDLPVRILEIGVLHGASLALWRDYFPLAEVFGMDCDPEVANLSLFDQPRLNCVLGNQSSIEDLASVAAFGPFDLIIDDAGHLGDQQLASFRHLFPQAMSPGGLYAIEDLHFSSALKPDNPELLEAAREGEIVFANQKLFIVRAPNG